jgi:hypothetical protein
MNAFGSHPIGSYLFNNHTIAASAGGTAAATVLVSSVSATYVKAWQIHNLSLRNLELIIGAESGTAAVGIFVPGNTTVSGAFAGMSMRAPIALNQGMTIRARTTENTAITCASTTPLAITLWA